MIIVAQHQNQYYGRSRAHDPARFGSHPSGGFREVNCRASDFGAGSFQTLSKPCRKTFIKRAFSSSLSPKTRSPLTSLPVNIVKSHSEDPKKSRKPTRSCTIAIPSDLKVDVGSRIEDSLNDEFPNFELWAGPAYSNSPHPSSLPMPNFSVIPKRTASFEMLASASNIDLPPIAKSAPVSPTRERNPSPGIVFDSTDSATQTLCRMLNLEITDG